MYNKLVLQKLIKINTKSFTKFVYTKIYMLYTLNSF